jgi:pyridoxal phosphate enzyme (YggS family)
VNSDRARDVQLAANLRAVRARIDAACGRAARDPASVTLVAVTKSASVEDATALARLGVADLAENRTDGLAGKRAALLAAGLRVRWHLIGHLQTNKVRRALPCFDVLHSLDRRSLVEALAAETSRAGRGPLPVFIQVNVSGESSKGGFEMNALWDALGTVRDTGRFDVQGLMTMAPLEGGAEAARPVFRRLRELRDEALGRRYLGAPNLSMGMSQDFETAVEEGATHVRVGSLLFS